MTTDKIDQIIDEKILELKEMLDSALGLYMKRRDNEVLSTSEFQDNIIDRYLQLSNELDNTDDWDTEDMLEMAVLMALMTLDSDKTIIETETALEPEHIDE
jgi:hypothetical protein